MTGDKSEFAVLYRFRVDEAREAEFIAAWEQLTALIRAHRGGRGSRLHRGDDGLFWAYAQWPNRAGWEADVQLPPEAKPALSVFRDVVQGHFDPIPLGPVSDLLIPEGTP